MSRVQDHVSLDVGFGVDTNGKLGIVVGPSVHASHRHNNITLSADGSIPNFIPTFVADVDMATNDREVMASIFTDVIPQDSVALTGAISLVGGGVGVSSRENWKASLDTQKDTYQKVLQTLAEKVHTKRPSAEG